MMARAICTADITSSLLVRKKPTGSPLLLFPWHHARAALPGYFPGGY